MGADASTHPETGHHEDNGKLSGTAKSNDTKVNDGTGTNTSTGTVANKEKTMGNSDESSEPKTHRKHTYRGSNQF